MAKRKKSVVLDSGTILSPSSVISTSVLLRLGGGNPVTEKLLKKTTAEWEFTIEVPINPVQANETDKAIPMSWSQ